MAEKVETYLLYGPSLDREAKLDLLDEVYKLPKVNAGKDVDTVVREMEQAGSFLLDFEYGLPVLTLNLNPDRPENLPDSPFLMVGMDELNVMPSKLGEEHVETAVTEYVDFVVEFYERSTDLGVPPRYVIGADPNQVDAFHDRFGWTVNVTHEGIQNGDVEQVFWLQILPPDTVDDIGREKVLSAPATTAEELADGAVLLVAYERPYPPGDPTDVGDHLGVDARQYFS